MQGFKVCTLIPLSRENVLISSFIRISSIIRSGEEKFMSLKQRKCDVRNVLRQMKIDVRNVLRQMKIDVRNVLRQMEIDVCNVLKCPEANRNLDMVVSQYLSM